MNLFNIILFVCSCVTAFSAAHWRSYHSRQLDRSKTSEFLKEIKQLLDNQKAEETERIRLAREREQAQKIIRKLKGFRKGRFINKKVIRRSLFWVRSYD